MRATILAATIGCLSLGCFASVALSAPHPHDAKKSSANKDSKERQQQKAASEPKGFTSICIGCGAK